MRHLRLREVVDNLGHGHQGTVPAHQSGIKVQFTQKELKTLAEFLATATRFHDPPPGSTRDDTLFKRYDTDGDGKLAPKEASDYAMAWASDQLAKEFAAKHSVPPQPPPPLYSPSDLPLPSELHLPPQPPDATKRPRNTVSLAENTAGKRSNRNTWARTQTRHTKTRPMTSKCSSHNCPCRNHCPSTSPVCACWRCGYTRDHRDLPPDKAALLQTKPMAIAAQRIRGV
jgi:hypothetical protein